ncbi:MAG TPA: glutamate--tRNA ligase [Candidatus Eremiobacteraeota bacterium]|nr:glutamate--tRNA ligase [Candidatus Eremiobacteraeota bacterium]
MTDTVRVRFAPSPTGEPHIGNIRTVVFNWLFARQNKGKFILRIEDTDRQRYQRETINIIMNSLKWLKLDWEEGPDIGGPCKPYTQSERLHLYKKAAEDLIASGHAYRCKCTPERLEEVRKTSSGYDRHCRNLSEGSISPLEPHVVRLKVPYEGQTVVKDMLKGDIIFENRDQQDLIILKSDGFPTYHLAVVVDDNSMGITHIIRGDDWIPTAPIHIILYKSFNYKIPVFCHVPLVIAEDGKKLSKRHGATSVSEFKSQGYLPEALFNFLALLGWSPPEGDTQEIFTREELIEKFDLSRVNVARACFSYTKLNWMNGMYIRNMEKEKLMEHFIPLWQKAGFIMKPCPEEIRPKLLKLTELLQARIKILTEVVPMSKFAFIDFKIVDTKNLVGKNMTVEQSIEAFRKIGEKFSGLQNFQETSIKETLEALLFELGLVPKQLYNMLRWAVTGEKNSPPLYGTIEVIGKTRTLERIEKAIELLNV